MTLLKECNKAINIEIAKEYRKEAKEILYMSNDSIRQEFLDYHKQDKGNICCLVLDKAKLILIKEGKMNKGGNFGKELF